MLWPFVCFPTLPAKMKRWEWNKRQVALGDRIVFFFVVCCLGANRSRPIVPGQSSERYDDGGANCFVVYPSHAIDDPSAPTWERRRDYFLLAVHRPAAAADGQLAPLLFFLSAPLRRERERGINRMAGGFGPRINIYLLVVVRAHSGGIMRYYSTWGIFHFFFLPFPRRKM